MTRDRFGVDYGEQLQLHEMVGPGLFQVHVTVAPEGKLGTDVEQGFVLYQTITPESEDSLIWRRSTSCRAGSKWASDRSKPLVDAIMMRRADGDRAGQMGDRASARNAALIPTRAIAKSTSRPTAP